MENYKTNKEIIEQAQAEIIARGKSYGTAYERCGFDCRVDGT